MIRRLAGKAKIEKRVHFHGLRHSFARNQLEQGTDVVKIQKMLGHSQLNTTQVYLDHVAPLDVVAAMKDQKPPEGL